MPKWKQVPDETESKGRRKKKSHKNRGINQTEFQRLKVTKGDCMSVLWKVYPKWRDAEEVYQREFAEVEAIDRLPLLARYKLRANQAKIPA